MLLAEDAGVPADGEGFEGIALAHNVEAEWAVDELLAAVEAAGEAVVKPGQAADWGGYSGYVADPNGHLGEVAYNPFPEID